MNVRNHLIVGGSHGIGYAIVRNLAKEGHNLYVIARTSGNLTKIDNVTHIKKDILTKTLDLSILPDEIHGVAYCPGSINLKPFKLIFKRLQYKCNWAIKTLKSVLKPLKKAGGSVVLFSTVTVQQGMPFHASAKGAIEGLTRSLAAEWAPKIRVNCIAPSLTDTPLASRLLSTPEKKEAASNRHPMKRVGSADELGSIAAFLLSQKSSWVTGQIIGVDGGLSSLKI